MRIVPDKKTWRGRQGHRSRRRLRLLLLLLPLLLLLVTVVAAATFDLTWWTIDGGGGTASSARYTLTAIIGQPEGAWVSTGETYIVRGGVFGPAHPADPLPEGGDFTFLLPVIHQD